MCICTDIQQTTTTIWMVRPILTDPSYMSGRIRMPLHKGSHALLSACLEPCNPNQWVYSKLHCNLKVNFKIRIFIEFTKSSNLVNFHLGWFTKKAPHKSTKNNVFPTCYERFWNLWGAFLRDQPKWKISIPNIILVDFQDKAVATTISTISKTARIIERIKSPESNF